MNFEVRIQNIGKLVDATVSVGDFTVFAGPNNTGKSFVSKLLYSAFQAMKVDHAKVYVAGLLKRLVSVRVNISRREATEDERSLAASFNEEASDLRDFLEDCYLDDILERCLWRTKIEIEPALLDRIHRMLKIAHDTAELPLKIIPWDLREDVHGVEKNLTELTEILEKLNAETLIDISMSYRIKDSLIQNFQIPTFSKLKNNQNTSAKVDIEAFGAFELIDEIGSLEGGIQFRTDECWDQGWDYNNTIYLESPAYWKLKSALEDSKLRSGHEYGRRVLLNGVPGYFYDLASALKFEYVGNMVFPEVYDSLTNVRAIGGRVILTEMGDLAFHEGKENYPLSATATGVANLGILALLIERKVLDKKTLIFIDEPEAHLHPAWQAVMAEALFELARQGARVVIATHSMDILKWLEVHVKKHPEHEELIALNRFPTDDNDPDEDFEIKMAKIMEDLTKPFSDLYLEGL